MPRLAFHFGIRPWQVNRLTFREAEYFLQQLKALEQSGG